MQPFNVKIGQGEACQSYTILPEESYFAIMFNDRIITAIKEKGGVWIEVPLAKVHSHDLEIISSGLHQQGSVLPLPIEEIGKEVSLILAGLPESDQDDICDDHIF
ncbi:hypothetical protein [Pedobacter rhodius]|uniref:Uncharacterized protein n=1 Tax=Pedobacter rhodius TaxID=3004098 RepID=A0ABT4L0W6_9SPHI|nr:hypothetical protein [Pedobacter sp. SJ11]MCZ4224823.1 hypothetical protein [Pedobacter sp. SJ11]